MRFDDMLATVLARPAERPIDRVAQWRQLLDLLAQHRPGSDPQLAREALARLQALRPDVPVAIRREIASAFAGRPIPAPLVVFLAADVPVVASAMLSHVRLSDKDWLAVLPRLSPTGRGVLRHRRDLGFRIERALQGFGASDMTLDGPAAVAPVQSAPPIFEVAEVEAPDTLVDEPVIAPQANRIEVLPPVQSLEHGAGEGQIRAIINRIAGYRTGFGGSTGLSELVSPPPSSFRFETGVDGIIRWVDGVSRGPLIGETIATPASGTFGVDGQAPGAFRRRTPFRDARLMIAGDSDAAGEWRIAGVPVFATESGRFQGYRGTARRPRAAERAEETLEPFGLGLDPDSLRQLVHELRTPLNAIGGFAEMIRRQMRGPVSTTYRERAQMIAEQAGRLLAAVDDLDVAARLETRRLDLQSIHVDLGAMLAQTCNDYREGIVRNGAALTCDVVPSLPEVGGDPAVLRRMLSRLVSGVGALATEGETVDVALAAHDPAQLQLAVSRPQRLAGQDEATLLDPGYGPQGDSPDGPLLGLGFSLHLVRRLAATAGGTLSIEDERFVVRLPAAASVSHAGAG